MARHSCPASMSKNVRLAYLHLIHSHRACVEADFFLQLYDAVVTGAEKIGHGRDGYFFGENGNYVWHEFSKAVGKALYKRGLSKSDEPTTFTAEEVIKYFGSEVIPLCEREQIVLIINPS